MQTKLNQRPPWCPHPDCQMHLQFQHKMCVGELPEPAPHDGDENTHRLCLDTRETHSEILQLEINHTDAWLLSKLLAKVK